MAAYKCFNCDKKISQEYVKKRILCPYCGSKILYKPKIEPTKLKAR